MSFARPKTRRAVARELRAARLAAGMTQRQLGARVDLPASAISAMEQGTRGISVEEFVLIARALGVDPKRLLNKMLS